MSGGKSCKGSKKKGRRPCNASVLYSGLLLSLDLRLWMFRASAIWARRRLAMSMLWPT